MPGKYSHLPMDLNNNMQFDKFVEKILLNEMPYVLVDVNDKRFDLEVEKFVNTKDLEGFIEKIKNLLNGTQLVDKYNNVAELKTEEEKELIIDKLSNMTIQEMADKRSYSRETVRKKLKKIFAHLKNRLS